MNIIANSITEIRKATNINIFDRFDSIEDMMAYFSNKRIIAHVDNEDAQVLNDSIIYGIRADFSELPSAITIITLNNLVTFAKDKNISTFNDAVNALIDDAGYSYLFFMFKNITYVMIYTKIHYELIMY